MTSLVKSLTALGAGPQANGGKPDQELSEQRLRAAPRAVIPRSLLPPWRSPFPYQRGTTRPFFQSVGMMPVFQAEQRTACNDMSTAFPAALRRSTWMPQSPSLPHFNRVNQCFHKQRWITVDWRVCKRDSKPLTPNSIAGWNSLVQLHKVAGPAGLHVGLLCEEPTTLRSNCSTLRDGLGGTQGTNSPVSRTRIT